MSNQEIYLCLLYFWLQGLLVPNFDDLHYIFLTEKCGMKKFMYDFLNAFSYIGTIFFTVMYSKYLSRVQVRTLILCQLVLFFLSNILVLINSLRINTKLFPAYSSTTSDIAINSANFFIASQALQSLSALPTQVLLTQVIPENVEAAMTAFITGTFVFCFEVGCKMSGSLFCMVFEVSNESLDRYWIVLVAKIPCILVTMALTQLIPLNEDVSALAQRLRDEKAQEELEREAEESAALLEAGRIQAPQM